MNIFYDTPFYASSPIDRRIKTAWFQHQPQTQFAVCWRALKYEDIKIKDYASLPQLRFGVQHYVNFLQLTKNSFRIAIQTCG